MLKARIWVFGLMLLSSTLLLALEPGIDASNFELPSYKGTTFKFEELKGKEGALLVFFASWCGQCNKQIPKIKEFATLSQEKGIEVIGISLQESPNAIKKFVKKKSIEFPVLLDAEMQVAAKYGVSGIPTLIGVNAKGKVVFEGHGMPDDLNDLMSKLTRN